MSNLVSERPGELIELVSALDQSAIDVDVAAGKRERVHLIGVDHIKMPVEIGPARRARDPRSELLHVGTYLRVGNDGQPGVDLLGVLAPDRDLLVLGDAAGERQ